MAARALAGAGRRMESFPARRSTSAGPASRAPACSVTVFVLHIQLTFLRMPRVAPAVVVVLLLAACGGERPTAEQREARTEARRLACISEALQSRGKVRVARLDTMLAQIPGGSPGLGAPHKFAQVYATYADLRAHEAAYVDSAAHSESKEDSTRFVQAAGSFRVNRPAPGSVEENVIRDYQRDLALSRQNPEHPCNRLVDDVAEKGD